MAAGAALLVYIFFCPYSALASSTDTCEVRSAKTEGGAIVAELNRIAALPASLEPDSDPTASPMLISINNLNDRVAKAVLVEKIDLFDLDGCIRDAMARGLYKVLLKSTQNDFNYDYGHLFLELETLTGIRGPFARYIEISPSTIWKIDDKTLQVHRWGEHDRSDANAAANLTAICLADPNGFSASMASLGFSQSDISRLKRSSERRLSIQGEWISRNCLHVGE